MSRVEDLNGLEVQTKGTHTHNYSLATDAGNGLTLPLWGDPERVAELLGGKAEARRGSQLAPSAQPQLGSLPWSWRDTGRPWADTAGS